MTNSHNQITCPKCHSAFSIDKSDYALISQQVRTKEFNDELNKKVKNEVSQFKKLLNRIYVQNSMLKLMKKTMTSFNLKMISF